MNHLRKVRQASKLPLWGLAARAHTSASMLGAVERFDYTPSEPVRIKIAAALGVRVEDIWPDAAAQNASELSDS